jgi:proton-coupled amino acid transporter
MTAVHGTPVNNNNNVSGIYQGYHCTAASSPLENPNRRMGSLEQDGLFSPSREGSLENNEHSEFAVPVVAAKTTARQSWIHLLKGYVGPGCLSLPWAVSQLGLVGGVAATFMLSYWSSYNCWTVVQLKRHLQCEMAASSNETGINDDNIDNDDLASSDDDNSSSCTAATSSSITYPDVAGWLYGSKMHRFTTACICTQQLAICTVFLSFVGANLQAVLAVAAAGTEFGNISHAAVLTLVLPAVLALSCLPNLRALAPVMAAGTALLLIALGLLGVVVVMEYGNPVNPAAPVSVEWSQVPLALCAILYSFEGINLILPIETAMAKPGKFGVVFWSAMVVTAFIFALVGALCVAAFGPVTNGSATAFLLEVYADQPNIRNILLAANAAVSLSVLVTYPLQLFPCLELVGPLLAPKTTPVGSTFRSLRDEGGVEEQAAAGAEGGMGGYDSSYEGSYELDPATEAQSQQSNDQNASAFSWRTRMMLVLSTYTVAILIPNVQSLISLAGALSGSSTALLIPPALELAWLDRTSDTVGKRYRAYAMLAGGFAFLCIGTVASLADIVRDYTH